MNYYIFVTPKVTGGNENLLQLGHSLSLLGANVTFCMPNATEELISKFKDSFLPYIQSARFTLSPPVDDSLNHLFLPEIFTKYIRLYRLSKISIFWLSVDNFFYKKHGSFTSDYLSWLKTYFAGRVPLWRLARLPSINHFTQSHYAEMFLKKHEIMSTFLGDYIHDHASYRRDSLSVFEDKKIVAYNPAKSNSFTLALIRRLYGLCEIVPLSGLDRRDLIKTLKRVSLYMDFGHHPGKDRLPREACLAGCLVVTSTNGSARYYEDIPILNIFKFDIRKQSPAFVSEAILQLLNNYNTAVPLFSFYRDKIALEEYCFNEGVRRLLGTRNIN